MNVDHFFAIGQQHVRSGAPCEDYALSNLMGEGAGAFAFAAISDGCGGAFADTDVGARAISFAFAEVARKYRDMDQSLWFGPLFMEHLKLAFTRRFEMTERRQDYLATLGAVISSPEKSAVLLFGDGAYLVRYADGRQRITWLEWSGNAPFYLYYTLDPADMLRFSRGFAEEGETVEPPVATECWTDFRIGADGKVEVLEEASRPLELESLMGGYIRTFEPAAEKIEAIALFSDGILRVRDVPVHDAAAEFTAFKNFRGGFVKRRMTSALKDYAREDKVPQDDLSTACVWYGE
jgi:hypothetical protein